MRFPELATALDSSAFNEDQSLTMDDSRPLVYATVCRRDYIIARKVHNRAVGRTLLREEASTLEEGDFAGQENRWFGYGDEGNDEEEEEEEEEEEFFFGCLSESL
eukprot:945420-Rhodomonas_salina.5